MTVCGYNYLNVFMCAYLHPVYITRITLRKFVYKSFYKYCKDERFFVFVCKGKLKNYWIDLKMFFNSGILLSLSKIGYILTEENGTTK